MYIYYVDILVNDTICITNVIAVGIMGNKDDLTGRVVKFFSFV